MVPKPARAVSLKAASVHGTIVIVRNYLCEIIDDWRVKVQLNFFFSFRRGMHILSNVVFVEDEKDVRRTRKKGE